MAKKTGATKQKMQLNPYRKHDQLQPQQQKLTESQPIPNIDQSGEGVSEEGTVRGIDSSASNERLSSKEAVTQHLNRGATQTQPINFHPSNPGQPNLSKNSSYNTSRRGLLIVEQ